LDVSVAPGDTFTITANGAPAAGGSYSWKIVSSQDGDNPDAFQFVSQPSCAGASSCQATVQATGAGFAGVQVTFQVGSVSAIQTARVRAITVSISQIWSDQFPGGPVANYLPAGAGLVGNARQLMIMGARSDSNGYLKANVVTAPNNQEAWNHVLVRFQPGAPWANQTSPNTNAPVGTCSATACVNGSVLSVSTPAPFPDGDYSVVAGVDRQGAGQASGILTAQGVGSTFFQPCVVSGEQLDFFTIGPPCSGGAVRIVSRAAYTAYSMAAVAAAAPLTLPGTLPTAANFLAAFALPSTPGSSLIGNPYCPVAVTSVSPQQLYFNDGVSFPNLGPTDINLYQFSQTTLLADHVLNDPDFQTLLTDTLTAHTSDVKTYFGANPGSASYTFPTWVVTSPSAFDTSPASEADRPPLFPCATMPNVECDLTFLTDADLFYAFGRVGYSLSIQATVSPSTSNPNSQWVLTSLLVSGYIYDYYQWNPAFGTFDYAAADIQSGYTGLGSSGGVYETSVNVYTPALTGITFTFH
jgi:hypothetical protein